MKTYKFNVGNKTVNIKAKDDYEAWTQLKNQLGFEGDTDDFMDDLQGDNSEFYDLNIYLKNGGSPIVDYADYQDISMNRSECEANGGVWVESYYKNGKKVQSYCRRR